ncbi:MICOS complex subunit Mic27 isoform X2 [Salmo trutta]|uniref:MICOS complex subunit Mic27 isoform X2 n=1 Tax=Salmo trutta TaxID=8032 RepID=UPI0011306DFE|nr:MICOS complex subunit Mic27-like isoform X2 [Salmo trutta]
MAPVVKLAAISAAMGMASFQVYAMSEDKTETVRLCPRELSIYAPDPPATHYMDEQPGDLQSGLGVVRVGLQPYVTAVKNAYTSVKVGAVTVYTAGHDTYEFLRDPPPGFFPRVSVITVSGLAGLILARKGPHLMTLGVPLGMVTVGMAVCYPTQTVAVVKMSGQKMYAANQYTTSYVASTFKSKPKEVTPTTVRLEKQQAPPAPIPETEIPEAKPLPEAGSSEPVVPAVDEAPPSEPGSAPVPIEEGVPSEAEPSPQPTTEVAPAEDSIDTEPDAADAAAVVLQEAVETALVPSVETALVPSVEEIPPPAPVEEEAASVPHAAEEAVPAPVEEVAAPPPIAEEMASAPAEEAAPPAPTEEEPSVIVIVTAGKPKFAPDPKLVDLGQVSPEDEDLYNMRG